VNQPNTAKDAAAKNSPRKFLFFKELTAPMAAKMVTNAKIMTNPIPIAPFLKNHLRIAQSLSKICTKFVCNMLNIHIRIYFIVFFWFCRGKKVKMVSVIVNDFFLDGLLLS
jgi:hypothetical protein